MSEYLAIDWERRSVRVVSANISRGQVIVRKAFTASWPATADPSENPQQAGQWIAQLLKQHGIGCPQVHIVLPREDTVVRQLDLPQVSSDEVADIVRLQIESRTATSLDELEFDFLPYPQPAQAESLRVLVFTIPQSRKTTILQALQSAGLEPVIIAVSPVTTAQLVLEQSRLKRFAATETNLVIARHGERLEFSLVRDRHLLMAHASRGLTADGQLEVGGVLTELRRAMGAFARNESRVEVDRAWVLGPKQENEELAEAIRQNLGYTVELFDPWETYAAANAEAADGHFGQYAASLGLLAGIAHPSLPAIDFLHPRRAIEKPDRRRTYGIIGAATVAILILVTWGLIAWRVQTIDRQIADLESTLEQLDRGLESSGRTRAEAAAVREWSARRISWPDVWATLHSGLLPRDRILLGDLSMSVIAGPYPARIEADTYAANRADVGSQDRQLDEIGFQVQPQAISAESTRDTHPFRFALDVRVPADLTEPPPAKTDTDKEARL